MAKNRDIQDIGIVFGEWKLIPLDDRNWELCHRHATGETARTRAAGTTGAVKWHRLGRYYSYNTFGNALLYAADCELKDGCDGAAAELYAALDRYEHIVEALMEDMDAAIERSQTNA